MCKAVAKPFLKWAGGKGQLLNKFEELFPQELIEGQIETYIEPFVGGGAVLFNVLQNYQIKKAYINDINKELYMYYLDEEILAKKGYDKIAKSWDNDFCKHLRLFSHRRERIR